jgi:hypothetical protein
MGLVLLSWERMLVPRRMKSERGLNENTKIERGAAPQAWAALLALLLAKLELL